MDTDTSFAVDVMYYGVCEVFGWDGMGLDWMGYLLQLLYYFFKCSTNLVMSYLVILNSILSFILSYLILLCYVMLCAKLSIPIWLSLFK